MKWLWKICHHFQSDTFKCHVLSKKQLKTNTNCFFLNDTRRRKEAAKTDWFSFYELRIRLCADRVEEFCSDDSVVLLFVSCFPIDLVAQQWTIPALCAAFLRERRNKTTWKCFNHFSVLEAEIFPSARHKELIGRMWRSLKCHSHLPLPPNRITAEKKNGMRNNLCGCWSVPAQDTVRRSVWSLCVLCH